MRLIGRRDFVRGLGLSAAAGAVLTPFARALIGEAQGAQATDRRWILVHDQMGMGHLDTERWIPNGADLTADGALPPSFEPLTPWASDMIIADRFYNPFNPGQHGNHWASLSVDGERPDSIPGGVQSQDLFPDPVGITVDIFAGETLSAQAPFRTVAVSTDNSGLSVDADLNHVPHTNNAITLFDQLFGDFDPTASEAQLQARLERRLSVLDAATVDLQRMRSRLAAPEREKLDQLEDSIRAIEDQLAALAEHGGCSLPPPPVEGSHTVGPHNGPLPPGYWEAMVDIQTAALTCRLTNVVVLRPTPGRRTYAEIFGHNEDKHNTSHADDTAALVEIDRYNTGLLARMLSALDEVPEGDGTMRDCTLATWIDAGGGRHHGGYEDIPVILVGNMQGHFDTGRYVQYAGGQHVVSDMFVSVLQGLGMQVDSFGDAEACQGPLPGLT